MPGVQACHHAQVDGGSYSLSLYLHHSCMGHFTLVYSFNYLCQCGLRDIYVTLGVFKANVFIWLLKLFLWGGGGGAAVVSGVPLAYSCQREL